METVNDHTEKSYIKHFYAVITPDAIGIFTIWALAKPLAYKGHNKTKRFGDYKSAFAFIEKHLSYTDLCDYG